MREEFLREVDGGFHGGAFSDEFDHLTETELKNAAIACLDFYGAKGEWPTGQPAPVIRHWLRGGIAQGKIRKAPAVGRDGNVCQGVQRAEPEIPLQPWHERIKPIIGDAVFYAWIRELWHDGNGKLYAPTPFKADYVRSHYGDDIKSVLKGVTIAHKPEPAKETVDA